MADSKTTQSPTCSSHYNKCLTKRVNPDWYRRYAKILNYEDRIYLQPLREIREEQRLLKSMEVDPMEENEKALEKARKLAEVRGKRVNFVLQLLYGKVKNIDVKSLKTSFDADKVFSRHSISESRKQTLHLRKRAIRPEGYVLSPKSKWRLFWENAIIMDKMRRLVVLDKSMQIKTKWIRAFRLVQCVNHFTNGLADIAGTTEELFKDFRDVSENTMFQKNYFKSTSVGKSIGEQVIFTLSKPEMYRSKNEAHAAAVALRFMTAFTEFPVELQDKICKVAWYLEVDKDKMIIRQGHLPNSFYFVLAGRLTSNKSLPDGSLEVIETHSMGAIIGEEGIANPTGHREFSVTAAEDCKVIAVSFDDYHRKCLTGVTEDINPDHTVFLSQLPFTKFFPMDQLVENAQDNILLFYYRSGTLILDDVYKSPFMLVVFKGSCRVLAKIHKQNLPKKQSLPPLDNHRRASFISPRSITSFIPSCRRLTKTSETKLSTINLETVTDKDSFSPSSRRLTKTSETKLATIDSYTVTDKDSFSPSSRRLTKTSESKLSTIDSETVTDKDSNSLVDKRRRKSITKPKNIARNERLSIAGSIEKCILTRKKTLTDGGGAHPKSEWLEMKRLTEGDVIGLETLDAGDGVIKHPLKIAVISQGASVILLLKSFYEENSSAVLKMDLRSNGLIFPNELQLKTHLKKRNSWLRFQNSVMNDLYGEKGSKNKFISQKDMPSKTGLKSHQMPKTPSVQ